MATPEKALATLNNIAKDFAECYILACRVYVRTPASRDQYKHVDANHSIMSSSFDSNLYLTKADVEYYAGVPIWILSPNDYWGNVRQFTRNEDIEIDPTTGIITDQSKKPWLKAAIGNPGNLTVFNNISKFLPISTVMYDQVTAMYYQSYLDNVKNHVIHYEFQGNPNERMYISKLLTMAVNAYSRAGPMAVTIPELLMQYFGNDDVMLFDYYDVLEVKAAVVVDEVFLLSPNDAYSTIHSITIMKRDATIDKEQCKKLALFGQGVNGKYAVTIQSSGPWLYVHPKLIPAFKEMITMYDNIRKQNADGNGGQDVRFTCEEHIARAMHLMKYLSVDDYEHNMGLYSLAVQLLKIRKDLLDPANCLISVGNDPINGSATKRDCKLKKTILDNFKAGNQGITELYVFPVNISGDVINEEITHITTKDNMVVNGVDLKNNKNDIVMTNNHPWLVLYNEGKSSGIMAKALYDSVKKIIESANNAVNRI